MNHIFRLVWNKQSNMLVAVAEFARSQGKAAGSQSAAAQAVLSVIDEVAPRLKVAVIAVGMMGAFPLSVHAQSGSFLDFSSLSGWTTQGGAALLSTTDAYSLGGQQFSLTPAAGNSMVKITPGGSSVMGAAAADAAMGLSAGTIAGLLGNNTTNFGLLSKSFTFNPGTYSFAWAYAAGDYQPYNDGVLFSVVGQGTQSVTSLARNGSNATDTSGPQANTLVLGSYGSTAWITSSFTIATAGSYQITYADYNWSDTGLDPVYYVSGVPGTFTGTAIVPVSGGTPAPAAISTGSTSTSSGLAAGTVAPTFDGGVLAMDTPNGTYAQDFTITGNGGTIDQSGTGATFTGLLSDAGGGTLHIVNSGTGGGVTFTAANTYTGATDIEAGATLALSGTGSIAASSGVVANGKLDIGATSAGASITSLAGSGIVTLGSQTLTVSNASGVFAGTIGGAGNLNIAGGSETLTGMNSYTGATAIDNGATLALSGAGSIANSSGVVNNGTLDLSAAAGNASISSLSGNGAVALGANSLMLSAAAGDFGGNIHGNGGLTVAAGKATLSGANTYTGATTIDTGATLALAGAGAIGMSSNVIANGTFDLGAAAGNASISSLSGSGAVALGTNTLFLSAAAGEFAGSIHGEGGLTVAGGNATLSGTNTYTGVTTIDAGAALALTGGGAIGGSSGVIANGTLDLAAAAGNTSIASLSGHGMVALGANNLILSAAASDFGGNIDGSGGVTVAAGSAMLSGTTHYTGLTQVDQGAALVLSGAGSVSASSGLLNNGTLTIASTAPAAITSLAGNGTVVLAGQSLALTQGAGNFSGAITGTGNLTVSGGVQRLSGANTMIGTVSATDGGTLKVASNSNLGAAANALVLANGTLNTTDTIAMTRGVTLSGTGTIQTDAGTTLTSSGATGGAGTLVKNGAGTLVLAGDNDALKGGATVNEGTLKLASASGVGSGNIKLNAGTLQTAVNISLAQNIALSGGTTINTDAGTTATLSGTVSSSAGGAGCFTKSGSGTLNVTGAGTYGMGVCVAQGTLRANGLTNATFVTVDSGAALRGAGTISAPITVRGTLAPGNSPGTLTSSSTVTMAAGSNFQEDINGTGTLSGPGNYSRLLITGSGKFIAGNATLTPNLVNITGADVYTPYVPKIGESYRIVTAAGGVEGRFGTVVQPKGLDANTRLAAFYNGDGTNSIDLRVLPASYNSFSVANGGNRNAQAAGTVLDRIMAADQAGTATTQQARLAYAASSLSGNGVGAMAQRLSGEVHAAMAAIAPLAGQAVQGSVLRQIDGPTTRTGVDSVVNNALWADLAGNRAEWDKDATASGFVANRGQLTVGVDAFRNDAGRIGVGFSHARANLSAQSGSGTLRENLAFVYGNYQGTSFGIDAMAGTGRTNWETERANPLDAGTLRTGLDGRNVLASIGISAPWQADGAMFKPFVRVLWQRAERDAGNEGTAMAALTLNDYSASGTRATAGLAGNVKGGEVGRTPYTMQYSVGVGRDNGRLARTVVDSSLAGISSTILAPEAGRAFMQTAVSGTVMHTANASSYYGITTEIHRGRADVSLSGGLRYAF